MHQDLVKNACYLYVEDDPFSRKLMSLMAENVLGAKDLTIFENSQDFLPRLKALPRRPDLIMLDILMKPQNGFEILELLRNDPDYRQTKIIALTASVMTDEVERLKASGFDGAIGKPFEMASFAGLIERILNGEAVWHVS
jgi:two-component system cell cycle response regulator DivK